MSKRKRDDGGDADDAPRRGMRTSTKIVLIAAGWVLLTLFLVGQFSDDTTDDSATARLDTVAGQDVDLDGDGVVDEVVEEEATDVNGDGVIEIGEGVDEGVATASGEGGGDGASGGTDGSGLSGDGSASGGSSGSGSGTYQATPTDSGGTNAVPGAAPSSGGTSGGAAGGSTATTTRSGSSTTTAGGGSSGGSSSTTSTTRATTTTTSGGGGSGTSSTSAPTTTTTTNAGQPPPPSNSAIVLIVKARNERYVYPSGYGSDFTLPVGSQIRFDNDEPENSTKHTFTIVGGWDSGDMKRNDAPRTSTPPFAPGTYLYSCKFHTTTMKGTITVA